MMAAYQKQVSLLSGPLLGIFGHDFVSAEGTDPSGSTPYQAMRYGLTVALMGDAYYFPNEDGASGYNWLQLQQPSLVRRVRQRRSRARDDEATQCRHVRRQSLRRMER
jgi:hypothetical protein